MNASFRSRLRAGENLAGVFLATADEVIAEYCVLSGADFLVLDFEHSTIDAAAAERAVRITDARAVAALARVAASEETAIARFLDAGGAGLVVPHVGSVDDVERVCELLSFPPTGRRGAGATRIADYGFTPTTGQWLAEEAERAALVVQIESAAAVANVREILAHARVDAAMIGARDLSIDLGVPGAYGSPAVTQAHEEVEAACQETETPLIQFTRSLEAFRALEEHARVINLATVIADSVRQPVRVSAA